MPSQYPVQLSLNSTFVAVIICTDCGPWVETVCHFFPPWRTSLSTVCASLPLVPPGFDSLSQSESHKFAAHVCLRQHRSQLLGRLTGPSRVQPPWLRWQLLLLRTPAVRGFPLSRGPLLGIRCVSTFSRQTPFKVLNGKRECRNDEIIVPYLPQCQRSWLDGLYLLEDAMARKGRNRNTGCLRKGTVKSNF